MPRILIIGAGSIGQRHLKNLLALGVSEIALLRSRAQPLDKFPDLPVFADRQDALAWNPQVVLVCTPTALHLESARPFLSPDRLLFLEKPLSHTWLGVDEFLQAVREHSAPTFMGYDLRFDPTLRHVHSMLQNGAIGRVLKLHAQVGLYLPDWHPWEDYRKGVSAKRATGGGVILDLIHELDYVTWLNGPVARIGCLAEHVSDLEIETEDVAAMILHFENGSVGTIELDYLQRVYSRTCRIVGDAGTIECNLLDAGIRWWSVQNKAWQQFSYGDGERNARYLAEMECLLACARGEASPGVTAEDGAASLKLALAAKESAERGVIVNLGRGE